MYLKKLKKTPKTDSISFPSCVCASGDARAYLSFVRSGYAYMVVG